jgi:septal ring factor EnvC (AmiA/AmiB activator)
VKTEYPRHFWGLNVSKGPWILGFSLCIFVSVGFAQRSSADAEKQRLQELRNRMEQLQRDLAKSEGSRTEAADALRTSEKAVSEANRALVQLTEQQNQIAAAMSDTQKKIDATKADVNQQQALLDRMLRHHYVHGSSDALRLALDGRDVAEVERQLQYFGYISKSRAGVIARLKQTLTNLAELEGAARVKKDELATNALEQQKARQLLEIERIERQRTFARIAGEISKGRREIGQMRRDEDRLTKLVDQITNEQALKAKHAEQRRLEQQRQQKQQRNAEPGKPNIRKPAEIVDSVADAGFVGRAFESLRGKLKLPTRGELAGRFGAPRNEGGVTWKGLFIKADVGQPVRSIADGRVTYADWLRGYGNLMIIDHGDGYMSLYGHNESLLKNAGENVQSGESIASVGSTGGALESGVYFELRYEGKPFDPAKWIGR